ncbi:MAG: anhydro-N-acetylmuramic acid kinase [Saprospiraceae bacterium]|nr:anhydro-N-acetylmuramic acid kinase [Saprospiraceae bacterium]
MRLRSATAVSAHELNLLDTDYGLYIGDQARRFCAQVKMVPEYIGWHGHTLFHDPARHSTCQIGHGGAVAGVSRIPTITQFRQIDLALGGQGAPLAPIADILLMGPAGFYINLGGISNISFYDREKEIRSFDVGPCNQILNRLANQLGQEYDPEGTLAASGKMDQQLFDGLNSLSFFHEPPPKSIDNNWIVGEVWPLIDQASCSTVDKLCTSTHHIAHQLAGVIRKQQNQRNGNDKIIVCGGGTHNDFLLTLLSRYLNGVKHEISKPEADLINFKEAALMGLMAFLFVNGKENVLSSVTGSTKSHIGGCFYQAPGHYKKIHE